MGYRVYNAAVGLLPFWVVSPEGITVATFKNEQRANYCAELLNSNPNHNTDIHWNKVLDIKSTSPQVTTNNETNVGKAI